MDKIRIKKNPNGDTRTAEKDVSFEQFREANDMHRKDVSNVMSILSHTMICRGSYHDMTKKTRERLFYDNFKNTMENGVSFVDQPWYQMHIQAERHHLNANCPKDVNLIDVLEMIADCVCAGKARSGEVYFDLDLDIVCRAVGNTIQLIEDMIEVVDE